MRIEHLGCEFKFAPDETKVGTFSGYGSVFGTVDSYGDVVQKGAFKKTLSAWAKRKSLPKMLLQHGAWGASAEDGIPVGVWTEMAEDDTGLMVKGELFALNTQKGQYIYEGIKSGALDGLSIGYIAREVAYGKKPEEPARTLKAVDLLECSIVTFPANADSLIESVKAAYTERDLERHLTRDAGFSRSEARAIINSGFKSLKVTRDADVDDAMQALRDSIARLTGP